MVMTRPPETSRIWELVDEALRDHPNADRTKEILKLLVERGLTQEQIARHLGLSPARVSQIVTDVGTRVKQVSAGNQQEGGHR